MSKTLVKNLEKIIAIALSEDNAFKDITSDLTITKNSSIRFKIAPREDIIFCGKEVIKEIFSQLKSKEKFKNSVLRFEIFFDDGQFIKAGKPLLEGFGDAKLIFAAERVILNFIQHLSGISTMTQKIIHKLNDKKINILDTRKTIPGLRFLQKYAVLCGQGKNHRFNLSDMILIKDNHISAAGGVKNAIPLAKKSRKKIEIECDNISQVKEAILYSPDIIMLDNMTISQIKSCSQIIRKNSEKIKIEVSGGVNFNNIEKYRNLDINFISLGSLTHSVRAVDIGLDVI